MRCVLSLRWKVASDVVRQIVPHTWLSSWEGAASHWRSSLLLCYWWTYSCTCWWQTVVAVYNLTGRCTWLDRSLGITTGQFQDVFSMHELISLSCLFQWRAVNPCNPVCKLPHITSAESFVSFRPSILSECHLMVCGQATLQPEERSVEHLP